LCIPEYGDYFEICLILLLRSVAWTNGLAAQVCNAPTGGAPTISKQGIEVPITIRGGGVFIPVVMNDGHTYSFLLDSGFEDSVLDPTTVRALHLKSEEEHTEAGPGGEVKTSWVAGAKRRVAGIALSDGPLSSLDLSGFAPLFGQHLDGVLGYDFFRQFVVILSYEHQHLTLCDPASFRSREDRTVPLHLDSRQPYIDVQMEGANGIPIQASIEIDTGKVDPFSISASFARKNGLLAHESNLLAVKGVSVGGETQAWLTRAKLIKFAGISIKNPVMGIAEENSDRAGQLGYGVLRRFTITFDYSRKQAYFVPEPDFDKPYEFDHAGFVLGIGSDLSSLTAFMVIAGTPAAAAGVREGDEIVTIDGRPGNSFTLDQARDYFEHAVGPQRLTIRRNGSSLSVLVACRPIV
jgi:Aspartyl protease/PDZ domain